MFRYRHNERRLGEDIPDVAPEPKSFGCNTENGICLDYELSIYLCIYLFILHCFRCHDWVLNPESFDLESITFAFKLSHYCKVVDYKYDSFWTINLKRNAPRHQQEVIYGCPALSLCRQAGYDVIHISHNSHTSRFLSREQQPFCQQLSEHQLCQHSSPPAVRPKHLQIW